MTDSEIQAAASGLIDYLSNASGDELAQFLAAQNSTSAELAAYIQGILSLSSPPSHDDMQAIGSIAQNYYAGQTLPDPMPVILGGLIDDFV